MGLTHWYLQSIMGTNQIIILIFDVCLFCGQDRHKYFSKCSLRYSKICSITFKSELRPHTWLRALSRTSCQFQRSAFYHIPFLSLYDIFYFIKHISVTALLLFPPKFIFQDFNPTHPFSRLSCILPQFPFTFSSYITPHLLQIFHRCTALLSKNPMCSCRRVVFFWPRLVREWKRALVAVFLCFQLHAKRPTGMSICQHTHQTWWEQLELGGMRPHSMTLDYPFQASNFLWFFFLKLTIRQERKDMQDINLSINPKLSSFFTLLISGGFCVYYEKCGNSEQV